MSDLEAFEAELDANRERIARRRAENPEAAARRYAYIRRQVTEDLKRQQAEQRRRQKAVIRARARRHWISLTMSIRTTRDRIKRNLTTK